VVRRAGGGGLRAVLVLLVLALLAGCADDATPSRDASHGVVIEHARGTTVVPAPPERVVTLGQADTQLAVALGAHVVGAIRDPTSTDGNWPGVEPGLPPDVIVLDQDVPDLEQIAALRPDLILAVSAQRSYLDVYDLLDAIAPTVAATEPSLGGSGDDEARVVGRALYRDDEAAALVAHSDRAVDRFAAAHPELRGTTFGLALWVDGTTYLTTSPQLQVATFLGRLGLTLPASFADLDEASVLARSGLDLVALSEERLDVLLQADQVLVGTWGAGSREEFLHSPVVVSSGLATSDRLHLTGPELTNPLVEPNPAVTDYVLHHLEQVLAS
jgi:iron complex transport system substrate-binding protein